MFVVIFGQKSTKVCCLYKIIYTFCQFFGVWVRVGGINHDQCMYGCTIYVQQLLYVTRQCLSVECDYLAARADQPLGMFTSGCGHHMHADCWKR